MGKYILRKNRSKPSSGFQRPNVVTVQRGLGGHKLPESKNDAVNLEYITENCLVKKADLYDAKGLRISNLKAPLEKSDAVSLKHFNDNAFIFPKNKNYIQLRGKRFTGAGPIPNEERDTLIHADFTRKNALCHENDRFQANGKLIENVADPVNPMDVANKRFVEQKIDQKIVIPQQATQPFDHGVMENFFRDLTESDTFFVNFLEQPMENHVLFFENGRFQARGKTLTNLGDAVFDTDATNRQSVSKMMAQQCLIIRQNAFQGKGLVIENVSNPIKDMDVANRRFVNQSVQQSTQNMTQNVNKIVNKSLVKSENVGVSSLSTNELLVLVETIGDEFLEIKGSLAIMRKDVLFLKLMIYFETSNTISSDKFTVDVWKLGQGGPADRMYSKNINIALPHQYEVIYIPNLKSKQSIGISCTTNTGTRSLPYKMWAVFEKVF